MIEIEGHFGSSTTLSELPVRAEDTGTKVRRVRRRLEQNTRLRGDGAIVMDESGNILPPSIIEEHARLEVPDSHREAFRRHERNQSASQEPTAEQRFEMRSAFGEGQTVIDATTGQTYTT